MEQDPADTYPKRIRSNVVAFVGYFLLSEATVFGIYHEHNPTTTAIPLVGILAVGLVISSAATIVHDRIWHRRSSNE